MSPGRLHGPPLGRLGNLNQEKRNSETTGHQRNVILDEPTNGLDVMATRAMRRFLHGLRDEGRCVLFSSHIMQEVAALCDRIVVIAGGRVVAAGTADELRAQTGESNLEDAFVRVIGSDEGLAA